MRRACTVLAQNPANRNMCAIFLFDGKLRQLLRTVYVLDEKKPGHAPVVFERSVVRVLCLCRTALRCAGSKYVAAGFFQDHGLCKTDAV